MKICYISPYFDYSGYAHAARDYVRAIDSVGMDVVIRIIKFDNGEYKMSDREKMLYGKDLQGVDMVIQHVTGNLLERKEGVINVAFTAWETTRVGKQWVDNLNKMDAIITFCHESKMAFERSGVTTSIYVVPHTFDIEVYKREYAPFIIPQKKDDTFVFYSIAQFSKKKGIDSLLKSYYTEFLPDENVLLLMHTYISHTNERDEISFIKHYVEAIKQGLRLESYPKIFISTSLLDDEGIMRLHNTGDCFVLPSRAEGWLIPAFDAMALGKTPIVTNWGGPPMFINEEVGFPVKYTMSPVFGMQSGDSAIYTGREEWAEPDIMDIRRKMRWVFENRNSGELQEIRENGKKKAQNFSYEKVGETLKTILTKLGPS